MIKSRRSRPLKIQHQITKTRQAAVLRPTNRFSNKRTITTNMLT